MSILTWSHALAIAAGGVGLLAVLLFVLLGTRVIAENQSGLVIKRFGPPLASGRIIALEGEAGYQARLLPPGWHFGLWRWRYKVVKVPVVVVQPGEIALVVAADGRAIPPERVLGRQVACDNFQDAEAFLRGQGERGRQISFLTAGTYRINPALFDVVTPSSGRKYDMTAADLHVYQMPPDRVGIVTVLDGRPIPAGDLAGPAVAGHDSFQRGQAFVDAGGCRGLQEEVLLSGAWNLNPWFVKVDQVPLTEIPESAMWVLSSVTSVESTSTSRATSSRMAISSSAAARACGPRRCCPASIPFNTRVMKVELVPTTNIVLNWANRSEAHSTTAAVVDPRPVKGRVLVQPRRAQIIHIGMKMRRA